MVVIIDYGSQYTQLITRRVRELGFYSRIVPASVTLDEIKRHKPQAIVLSGGPASVYDPGAPQLPEGFLSYQEFKKIPILGICYGMQLLALGLGGEVRRAGVREYGRMEVRPVLSEFFAQARPFHAWMSDGDEVVHLPEGFSEAGRSSSGSLAAMENKKRRIYALQFHPEVTHTENGKRFLERFLKVIGGITPNWNMSSVLEEQVAGIRERVGPEGHVICGLSGGVDSAVAAVLVHRAIGDRLHCFFIDHGLLRYKERERILELFEKQLKLPVICLDRSQQFLEKLRGVEDPEAKRKIIGSEFILSFEEAAKQIQARAVGRRLPEFLVQGTLYPDVIESSAAGGPGIKSHHNVGGLPKDLRFQLIEPLRELFKDEVRELGRKLQVPEAFLKRHPFPGPGLAVRVIGDVTPARLEVLREVDEIFLQEIENAGLYEKIWQAFAVFLPIKSVGVQGDGRTHDHVVALRAVTSMDGMTADWYPFEPGFLARASTRICNEVRGVNRVVYDVSSKPPATIEWE